jgi:hypothetical protein
LTRRIVWTSIATRVPVPGSRLGEANPKSKGKIKRKSAAKRKQVGGSRNSDAGRSRASSLRKKKATRNGPRSKDRKRIGGLPKKQNARRKPAEEVRVYRARGKGVCGLCQRGWKRGTFLVADDRAKLRVHEACYPNRALVKTLMKRRKVRSRSVRAIPVSMESSRRRH